MSTHPFSLTELERHAERRRDVQWVATQLNSASGVIVLCHEGKVYLDTAQRPVFLPAAPVGANAKNPAVFLGTHEGRPYFMLTLQEPSELESVQELPRGEFMDLKPVLGQLGPFEGPLLAYASALSFWHSTQRYCGRCGAETSSEHAGHSRRCSGEHCGIQHFPRLDPAVIALITYEDRCLLARQPVWPEKLYSALAGFVEPGESLEEALAREMREEVGISLKSMSYHSSQPWPFPRSLMLAFRAEAAGPELKIDPEEIEDARWLTREEVRRMHASKELKLPSSASVARRMIEQWLAEDAASTE